MKVDALLTAAPKGEVRRDVHFIKDTHRWDFFSPLGSVVSLEGIHAPFFVMGLKIAMPSFQGVPNCKSFDLQFC